MTAGPTVVRRRAGVTVAGGGADRLPHPIVAAMRAELAVAHIVAQDACLKLGPRPVEADLVAWRRAEAVVDYLEARVAAAEQAFGRG